MLAGAGILSISFDVPPHRLSGSVYGALLNHRSALTALGHAVNQPPYNAPPKSPVLFVKPRNTLGLSGEAVGIPAGIAELEVGASLGLVIGRTACAVSVQRALDYVAGYLIIADVSVPHSDYFRPSIRCSARDGYCPLGPAVTACAAGVNPDALTLRVNVDGTPVQSMNTADLIRPAACLLADVSEFMTLRPGDILALGAAAPAPRVRAGQRMTIGIDGFRSLDIPFTDAVA